MTPQPATLSSEPYADAPHLTHVILDCEHGRTQAVVNPPACAAIPTPDIVLLLCAVLSSEEGCACAAPIAARYG